ncbi:GTP pyrophosphokinase [Shewanella sp. Choline-02u-19]|jgi:ppGpp synthetase/RelA/SpoT-type nucleotidyltranferase|uniref:RelA/SpoT domain-containing protein n=1 Tax=unclassified Shewanella TaxID=196818 RepID=UPI000C34F51A|nr:MULTISPECIES: RelA/SpoT domain-containing protein [unclassified Shewanella]PKG56642.1 GTP pyrophosphokinase [Shewanella sp. GutDb-MelDb]PKG76783.1 GTP pyrophosphokinase [Shewanella sp. GutCb]PKH54456.1 GTP pyrophosphokinase [Shewanella sp. Bg11-22]PKI28513.1 GTP pyrophosphokinase [Shewanella sp. Choline-02u-19]
MNRLLRTFFIFLLLLSTRSAIGQIAPIEQETNEANSGYSAKLAFANNLDGLAAIESMQYQQPRQTSADLDTLYAIAPDAQQELADLLSSITNQTQTHAVLADIKSRDRAQVKLKNKLNNDASQLTDLVRASIVSKDIYNLMQAYALVKSDSQIIQVKNRFSEPKDSGYRDLNLLVKLPKSQMIAEIQLHLADIADIKSGDEHLVYEQVQQMQNHALQQQRDLSDIEKTKIVQLRQESHKQYHKAWLKYKRLDQADFLVAA